jgi:hypothetical protein
MKKPKKPTTPKTDSAKKSAKKKYKVRNWKEYDEALVNRGRVIFHITKEAIEKWEKTHPSGKPGKPRLFNNIAIETALTIQQYFRLPLRSVEGLVADMLTALGSSAKSPDHSTLSKRGKMLPVTIHVHPFSNESLHLVVDSSGIKVYGEGEWKVRQHGISKRRTWKKIHLGFDAHTRDIVVASVTDNSVHDSEEFPELLEQIPEEVGIDQVSNDGGYDTATCYEAIRKRGARAVIPPRKDAKIWQHGNCKAPVHSRDANLRRIRKVGRKQWKIESGYHLRSLAENGFFRYKTIFGDRVPARTNANQETQLLLRCKLLNRFTALGMPESYAVV